MELDSGVDSVSSTPRSVYQHNHNYNQNKLSDREIVRVMCSFGGKILPRPHDNQLRYVGGDTRIVAVPRSASFSLLISKLSKLVNNVPYFTVKYQLPNEDLDALITVSSDEDVENMIEEFDRLSMAQQSNKVPRLRLFLFPSNNNNDDVNDHDGNNSRSNTSSIASLLDGSRKRENWFLDALNGGVSSEVAGAPAGSGDGGGGGLERGRSEASSIVSEVPDYLFGLDNVDEPGLRFKNRTGLGEMVPGSDPGSPAFGSTSSATPMPNLPPVKTKPEHPVEEVCEPVVQQATVGYAGGPVWAQSPTQNPGSPYRGHHHPMQPIPVYYVPVGPGQNPGQPMQPSHMQPVPVSVPSHYVQHYTSPVPPPVMGPNPGQVPLPVPYHGSGPMYGGSAPVQQVYYGVKNPAMGGHYPGPLGPVGGEEAVGPGFDPSKGRNLQG